MTTLDLVTVPPLQYAKGVTLNINKRVLSVFPEKVQSIILNFRETKRRRKITYFQKKEGDRHYFTEGEQVIIYDGQTKEIKRIEVVASHSVGSQNEQYLIGQSLAPKAGDIILSRTFFQGKYDLKAYYYFS